MGQSRVRRKSPLGSQGVVLGGVLHVLNALAYAFFKCVLATPHAARRDRVLLDRKLVEKLRRVRVQLHVLQKAAQSGQCLLLQVLELLLDRGRLKGLVQQSAEARGRGRVGSARAGKRRGAGDVPWFRGGRRDAR